MKMQDLFCTGHVHVNIVIVQFPLFLWFVTGGILVTIQGQLPSSIGRNLYFYILLSPPSQTWPVAIFGSRAFIDKCITY